MSHTASKWIFIVNNVPVYNHRQSLHISILCMAKLVYYCYAVAVDCYCRVDPAEDQDTN